MSDRPCMLNPSKWRVASIALQLSRSFATFRIWGVWPPQWDLAYDPLLSFPTHMQAYRAAHDRAQFMAYPDAPQQKGFHG